MSEPTSSGERLFILLGNLRTQNGNLLTREQWIKAATDFIAAEIFNALEANRKAPRAKGVPKPARPRNPLFDTLAIVTGTRNLAEMTKHMSKQVGVALAAIMEATPSVTVEEIQRRAQAFRYRHPTWNMTAQTLAKYWGNFSPSQDHTRGGEVDVYLEPKTDWKAWARVKYADTPFLDTLEEITWRDVPLEVRKAYLKDHPHH